MEASPTIPLSDLDTANKLRSTFSKVDYPDFGEIEHDAVWPGWPVDTLPWVETSLDDVPLVALWGRMLESLIEQTPDTKTREGATAALLAQGISTAFRPVRAGDRVTFTVDGVPVFSAEIDPVPVIDGATLRSDPPEPSVVRWSALGGYTAHGADALPDEWHLPISESTRFVLLVRADTIEDA